MKHRYGRCPVCMQNRMEYRKRTHDWKCRLCGYETGNLRTGKQRARFRAGLIMERLGIWASKTGKRLSAGVISNNDDDAATAAAASAWASKKELDKKSKKEKAE